MNYNLFHFYILAIPESALVRPGDCTFTRGLCGWTNVSISSNTLPMMLASPIHRPYSIKDSTYGARGDL